MTFAVLLLWNPTAVIGSYFAAASIVLFSRLVFPEPRLTAPAAPAVDQPASAQAEQEPLAIAA
jgi:hypothetical protein